MSTSNPAAQQGWVKSVDPKSGRTFYANRVTRKTQWEKPDNWIEEEALAPPPNPYQQSRQDEEDELPANWEVMHDPTTGKPFYVDHERKITTWTRPTAAKASAPAVSHAPATVATSSSSFQALRSSSPQRPLGSSTSAYTASSSYYNDTYSQPHQWHQEQVDFSDSMPTLEFSVKKVEDALRPNCPHCDALFTMSKRRHHCRLCGDVFCDNCSSHRVNLPLEGPEFEKPVRVCDFCNVDIEKGNFFSMRRYFTPILLYKPGQHSAEDDGVASASNVNAALAALTSDFDQMLNNPSTTLEDKVTIPPDVFVPALVEHLFSRETADRTVRAVASLLALESIAGKTDYAHAIFLYGGERAMESIMGLLERTGSDRRTLFIQEQTARALFYLTEPKVLTSLVRKYEEMTSKNDESEEYGSVESLDLPRALRNMLDHCQVSKNPNLQRWSTSTIHHLVLEDQRRTCLAINEVAAAVASGQSAGETEYKSFLDQLVSTGGVMILCSLIGAEDADTRAHAVGTCQAVLSSTRIMDNSRAALAEMTGGQPDGSDTKDGEIVRAIIAGGGCGSSVSQLLISADNAVAGMGIDFCASLVGPLLSQAAATASLPQQYDWRNDNDGMGASREAAIEIATGSCLPALLSLTREHVRRPLELKKAAMETLAAVVLAIGEMGRAWACGKYEEGLERAGAPAKLKESLMLLNEEGTIDGALELLQSSSAQSLGSTADTPASRMRECAGIILASLTSCSAEAIMELQTRKIVSPLLLASNDKSMLSPSTIRGDTAPRCLGVLETVASVLMFAWQHPSGASSELLDALIEALDVGAISFLSKVLQMGVEWDSKDKAIGGMKSQTACFRLLCCLFGIALTDETAIGMRRLMDAVDADSYSYNTSRNQKGPHNIVEAVLGSLQVSSSAARKVLMGSLGVGAHYQTALMDMLEAASLATGSMCGSSVAPSGGEGTLIKGDNFLALRNDEFVNRRRDICGAACDVVVRGGRSGPALLPTMLVGGFGEGTCLASLRLALSIAQNGQKTQHAKLAHSGVLVPISDILRSALSNGDLYKFSAALAIVRFCGPYVASGDGSGGLQSVRDAIRIATNVLTLPIPHESSIEQIETQEALKSECISALESLSHNAALWNAISTDALPSMVRYLQGPSDSPGASTRMRETRCAALRVFLQLVQVPSHAVAAAESGLSVPLGKLMRSKGFKGGQEEDDEVPMLALEVLQVISNNANARKAAKMLDSGVARDICNAVGNAATDKPKKPTDSRANVTVIGLDILHTILLDVESDVSTQSVLQSPAAIAFLDAIAAERGLIRAMCATLLLKTGMKLPVPDPEEGGETSYDIPSEYGPPLVLVKEKCGGYENSHDAVAAILFSVATYACAIDSKRSETFWNTCMLKDMHSSDPVEVAQASASFCAHFLSLLDNDHRAFLPKDTHRMEDFNLISRPLVRHHLLESLKDAISAGSGGNGADPFFVALFVKFNVPKILLGLWSDPALLDVAFGLLKQIVEIDPDDVLHLFVESKEAILALFNMLNLDPPQGTNTNINELRRFLASILSTLAENGLLASAVTKFDVRSSAIAALAAACLTDEVVMTTDDDDEDMTSNRLSSGLMRCLVELCTVRDAAGKQSKIVLSSHEAVAIAKTLGKKLCEMVLTRFLERAKLHQYEMEEDEEIMNAPDVAMLTAVAQHDGALQILRGIGGLHALSQIASEGELSAVLVLKKACEDDFSLLLEADTFKSIMLLFKEDHVANWRAEPELRCQIEAAAFELLGRLCDASQRGRKAVGTAEECGDCTSRAVEIVSSMVSGGESTGVESTLPPPPAYESDSDEEDTAPIKPENPPTAKSLNEAGKLEDSDEVALCASALTFLSALVPLASVCKEIVENEQLVKASSELVGFNSNQMLQHEAVKLMKSLAPYAKKDQALNPELIAGVLEKTLKVDVDSGKISIANAPINANLMYSTTISGLQVVFNSLPGETQLKVAQSIACRFTKTVKSVTTARGGRSNGGQLAYNLTSMLLLARGKDATEVIFTSQLMTSLVHLIQWRYDPKTKLDEQDASLWNASVTHCLQILSMSLMTTEDCLVQLGVKRSDLTGTVLMVARAGKAPRKAIDLNSALSKAIAGPDAASSVAAQQLKTQLIS